jgi:hypothetical protein
MRQRWHRLIWIAPLAILGIALFVTLGGAIVKYLWNWLVPPLIGWHEISFWQALGLLVLCRILFGGHGWRGSMRSNMRRHMEARCANMTPEEREQFRQKARERWGFGPPPAGEAPKEP